MFATSQRENHGLLSVKSQSETPSANAKSGFQTNRRQI